MTVSVQRSYENLIFFLQNINLYTFSKTIEFFSICMRISFMILYSSLFSKSGFRMTTFAIQCTICGDNVIGRDVNEHLREHDHPCYDVLNFETTLSNIRELFCHQLVAQFNSTYGAIKRLLESSGIWTRLMPELDIVDGENSAIFVIANGIFLIKYIA